MIVHPDVEHVLGLVAEYYDVPVSILRGRATTGDWARRRRVAIFIAREATGASPRMIGRSFGGRHHTSVLNSVTRTRAHLENGHTQTALDVAALRVKVAQADLMGQQAPFDLAALQRTLQQAILSTEHILRECKRINDWIESLPGRQKGGQAT